MTLPAPGRFSTTNCLPKRSLKRCPTRRVTMSAAPPGAVAMISVTGFSGYAAPAAKLAAAATTPANFTNGCISGFLRRRPAELPLDVALLQPVLVQRELGVVEPL